MHKGAALSPGISCKWVDMDRTSFPAEAPITKLRRIMSEADPDFMMGFVCLTLDALRGWVTPTEYARLKTLGYRAVELEADKVWELDGQAIIGRKRALRKGVRLVELYS